MASTLPPLPASLKAIQHYLKIAMEHDQRDPVVAYYCRVFALQKAIEKQMDKSSPDARTFLLNLMDFLEKGKKQLADNEAISNEVVGQAHVENYALKVFLFADNEDRAGRFNKNVVKSYYTSGMLFDVLSTFGEVGEDIEKNKKYAKWKATYIHNCLKNGETPVAGPVADEEGAVGGLGFEGMSQPGPSHSEQPPGTSSYQPNPSTYQPPHSDPTGHLPQPGTQAPANTPAQTPTAQPPGTAEQWQPPPNPGNVQLGTQQYQKAMKYCKYAGSALQYEDSTTAIENLQKALCVLTTGQDS